MTNCHHPRCQEPARWAVGPDDRQLCRRHMLDALLASNLGRAYAVALADERPLADRLRAAAGENPALADLLLEAAEAVA